MVVKVKMLRPELNALEVKAEAGAFFVKYVLVFGRSKVRKTPV